MEGESGQGSGERNQGFGGADPFRDIRGDGEEGQLMGPASLSILCAVCCVCTLVSLLIAYLVWAISTIATSVASTSVECGLQYNVWVFCLMVVIIMPVLGCAASVISYYTAQSGLQSIPGIMNLAMAVWGMIVWGSMSEACTGFYDTAYPDLFLLFKINVVLLAMTFFMFLCVIIVGAAFLGGALASDGFGRGEGYQNVPGGDDGARDENLRTAARYGRVDEVEGLLRQGSNVNARDMHDGRTALHWAALGGHTDVARRLVNAGANIDAETKAGDTPLRLAQGKHEVENFLRSCGARDSMASPGAEAATTEYV